MQLGACDRTLKLGLEISRARIASFGVELTGLTDNRRQALWLHKRFFTRRGPSERKTQGHPQRVDIASSVRLHETELLRRGVAVCPHEMRVAAGILIPRTRNAKVNEHRTLSGDHDVVRLDVAMDNGRGIRLVKKAQCIEDAAEHGKELYRLEWPVAVNQLRKRHALELFHDDDKLVFNAPAAEHLGNEAATAFLQKLIWMWFSIGKHRFADELPALLIHNDAGFLIGRLLEELHRAKTLQKINRF